MILLGVKCLLLWTPLFHLLLRVLMFLMLRIGRDPGRQTDDGGSRVGKVMMSIYSWGDWEAEE